MLIEIVCILINGLIPQLRVLASLDLIQFDVDVGRSTPRSPPPSAARARGFRSVIETSLATAFGGAASRDTMYPSLFNQQNLI